ncbi:hypothetical protein B0T26DRAFT_803852 [Lasiosphaeria miniovina]|uniref:Uncharacterized protein n=1 Tax=Lasiosphaeria miniovina TaxID=1954250 RepID=A0AA40ABU7_9PEZI|nr:uncharacterized protein B0T26DRAFT_803852 [Lasiosphaeria miniovina]KAK0712899.1 hypothetical protein B0T26DRAFT_803852 [Lasiosphaeria miniovina]
MQMIDLESAFMVLKPQPASLAFGERALQSKTGSKILSVYKQLFTRLILDDRALRDGSNDLANIDKSVATKTGPPPAATVLAEFETIMKPLYLKIQEHFAATQPAAAAPTATGKVDVANKAHFVVQVAQGGAKLLSAKFASLDTAAKTALKPRPLEQPTHDENKFVLQRLPGGKCTNGTITIYVAEEKTLSIHQIKVQVPLPKYEASSS